MIDLQITIALPGEVEKVFSKELSNKKDIISLITSAEEKRAEFEELVFTAKYLMGLLRASSKEESASYEAVKKEITDNIKKVQEIIKEIAEDNFAYFESKYFKADPEALKNLTSLLGDLELIKLYLNDLKRKS